MSGETPKVNYEELYPEPDEFLPPIDIYALLRCRDIINLAELARLIEYPEQTVMAWVRRGGEKVMNGKEPSPLPEDAARRITHELCKLGVTIFS